MNSRNPLWLMLSGFFFACVFYRQFNQQLAGRSINAAKALATPPSSQGVATLGNLGMREVNHEHECQLHGPFWHSEKTT